MNDGKIYTLHVFHFSRRSSIIKLYMESFTMCVMELMS